jgi:hypothetical protein
MTRYFLRLPMQPSVAAALDYADRIGPAMLERGPDGTIRGSVEVVGERKEEGRGS